MKRRTLALALGLIMALGLTACGGSEETAPADGNKKEESVLDLTGTWAMEPDEEGTTMSATISADSIVVNWLVDGDEWLYWSGSYTPPTDPGDSYTWTSQADGAADTALLASSDETKDFSYKGGVLSFDVTIQGETATVKMEKTGELETEKEPETSAAADTYKIGETWTVDGQWSLTIDSVTATDDRNEYSDKNPAAVYLVDYTYANEGYEDQNGIMNGLYMSIDSMIVDSTGLMGYSYPGNITSMPQETPVGARCKAQACIGVDNPGDFELTVIQYDGNGDEQKATFLIEVE